MPSNAVRNAELAVRAEIVHRRKPELATDDAAPRTSPARALQEAVELALLRGQSEPEIAKFSGLVRMGLLVSLGAMSWVPVAIAARLFVRAL